MQFKCQIFANGKDLFSVLSKVAKTQNREICIRQKRFIHAKLNNSILNYGYCAISQDLSR